MKKHFLILASLVLGIGQLFADQVTFSASDLNATLPASNTKVDLPYTWKVAPYHVTATIARVDGTTPQLNVGGTINMSALHKFTVSVGGKGTLNKITFTTGVTTHVKNVNSVDAGNYADGVWTPTEGTTSASVTFTFKGAFNLKTLVVDYTPDENYTPDDPNAGNEPIEATPVDNLASYTGNDPFVYDQKALKYYALNSLGEYEEYGVFTEVNSLKVAGTGVTEIEYIKTNSSMGITPYINLNYIPKKNTKAVCTLTALEGGEWQAAYGCGYFDNGWKDRFCFFTTNATIDLGGETGDKEAMRYGEKIVTVLDAAAGTLQVFEADGETLIGTITDSRKTADCKTPLYVFAQNKDVPNGGTQTDCYNKLMTLYGLQIYEGETLVMDLVPAVNGEGKGGLKDKLTGTYYPSANSGEFELSADAEAIVSDAGIPVYEGKMVIFNGHLYEYTDGEFVDKGAIVYSPISEIGSDYQNLSNWNYPGSAYDATFGVNVFDEATGSNTLNPYVGAGGWEPLSYKITGLSKGDNYRVSFNYTGTAWRSWSNYTVLPFYVLDYESMPGNEFNKPEQALGYIALPNTETTNQPYSTYFTAAHNYALLCIQFGVVDDGNHGFAFSFSNIKVEKRTFPAAYRAITWADPVKYTELAYIENTGANRENAFTLPYSPVTGTQIVTKFNVYNTSSGWSGIFCGRNIGAGTGISLYMNGNKTNFGYFTGSTAGSGDNFAPFTPDTDYEVTADVTKLVLNGTEYPTGNTTTNPTSRNLSLFANPETDYPMRGRFYYCTIKEDGETRYNFKPVIRHDGVFGFYDKTSRVFVQPAQGKLDGYGFKKLDDQSYLTYTKETRIVIVGTTGQFLPDAQNLDGATYTWTSADEDIATVAQDGTVTGVAAGKVMITASTDADQGWTASYELTVSEPNYVRKDANGVGYAIVTGGNGWGDSPVANLLDNNADTKFGCSGTGEAWAIMIASEPVAVKQYSIVTGADTYNYPGRNPASWKLEGSNDNQNWTLIDEKVQTYQLQAKNKEEFTFQVDGTETYKFFKFSATQLADGFQMGEFWINAQEHQYGDAKEEVVASCTEDKYLVYECPDCHAYYTKIVPMIEHTYVNGTCTACGALATEVVLLPNGQQQPYYAKFRHANTVTDGEYADIEEGWTNADFDDSAWGELMMPLGTNGYGVQHTIWVNEYNTFWFRREFNVEKPSVFTKLTLKTLHDDDYAVFVNGTLVHTATGWTNGTEWYEIDVNPALLVAGKNVVAMYIEQNFGGAYCDFSLEGVADITTDIKSAKVAENDAPIYNIAGQRISKMQKGVNIMRGMKVLK